MPPPQRFPGPPQAGQSQARGATPLPTTPAEPPPGWAQPQQSPLPQPWPRCRPAQIGPTPRPQAQEPRGGGQRASAPVAIPIQPPAGGAPPGGEGLSGLGEGARPEPDPRRLGGCWQAYSWQDPSWSQDGPHGGGKGKSQGRGCGRRGKGSKARLRQEARHAQPRTEKQRHFKERRAGRAAERLTTALQNINEHRGGSGSCDRSREAHDGASGPNPEPAELPLSARWFQ